MEGVIKPWSILVWSAYGIPKHSFLLWLALGMNLKTQDKMKPWDCANKFSMGCVFCQQEVESHRHLFFECPYLRLVWFECRNMIRMNDVAA